MIVLSYDNAKRSLFNMAVYLICTSLIIKGFGYLIEFNAIQSVQALISGQGINFSLPEFNMDSLSFDMIQNTIKEKFQEIVTVLIPSTIGFVNAQYLYSMATSNQLLYATSRVALRV